MVGDPASSESTSAVRMTFKQRGAGSLSCVNDSVNSNGVFDESLHTNRRQRREKQDPEAAHLQCLNKKNQRREEVVAVIKMSSSEQEGSSRRSQ